MKDKVISGLQQVGIGVKDANKSWQWYKNVFGVDIPVVADTGVAERMLPYTGGKPQPRYAILAINLQGGGGMEIWEPQGRELNYIKDEARLGDYGIFVAKIKAKDVDLAYKEFKNKGIKLMTGVTIAPDGKKHFFLQDPWNNLFEICQDVNTFTDINYTTGGTHGAIIGVSDMDKTLQFYKAIMNYDVIEYDKVGVFEDLKGLTGCENKVRRVLVSPSTIADGPLGMLYGYSALEFIQVLDSFDSPAPKKIYEGRMWGDPGFIHICFDIRNMNAVEEDVKSIGSKFVCDSGADFDMGDANGHFTYIEDPDGTLIEFVETFKVPILKKLGLALNLKNRDPHKNLYPFLIKALKFMRKK
ncbi:MAG: VOC family protein [Bacteroidales bacterium]